MSNKVYMVTRVVQFANGSMVTAVARVVSSRAAAERFIEQAQAEISTLLAGKLIIFPPGSTPVEAGRGETVLGVVGVAGIMFRYTEVEAEESAIVLPQAPKLIVPG